MDKDNHVVIVWEGVGGGGYRVIGGIHGNAKYNK